MHGCERPVRARGWCQPHYHRWLAHGDVKADVPVRNMHRTPAACRAAGCDRRARNVGWCKTHYIRWRIHGDARADVPIRQKAADGTYAAKGGYRQRYMPSHPNADATGRILEHRLVMSTHLGRPLRNDETVHHRNGDRADNRIDNLELWSSNHSHGQRIEELYAWAQEIVATYGPEIERLRH